MLHRFGGNPILVAAQIEDAEVDGGYFGAYVKQLTKKETAATISRTNSLEVRDRTMDFRHAFSKSPAPAKSTAVA
jgi:hypothetical protein